MKLVLILSAALGFLQLPTLALAGDSCGGGSQVQALFDAADADGDGVLSAAEYGDSELARFGASFDEIDADGNGEDEEGNGDGDLHVAGYFSFSSASERFLGSEIFSAISRAASFCFGK